MANIGERAELTIMRTSPIGLFLDAGPDLGDILLPISETPKNALLGSKLEVFLYRDSEDRPIATRQNPKVCLLYTSPSPRDQRGSRMPSSA